MRNDTNPTGVGVLTEDIETTTMRTEAEAMRSATW